MYNAWRARIGRIGGVLPWSVPLLFLAFGQLKSSAGEAEAIPRLMGLSYFTAKPDVHGSAPTPKPRVAQQSTRMDIVRRCLIAVAAALAASSKLDAKEALVTPKIEDVFLLLVTDKMIECQHFYEAHFGFTTVFESKIYTQLASPEHLGKSFSLAFMPTKHPFGVVPQVASGGTGIMLTIQTADVDALHAKLVAEGVAVIHGPKSEPWGQRRFDVRDPAGTYVDVVQSIDPQPGWIEQFK